MDMRATRRRSVRITAAVGLAGAVAAGLAAPATADRINGVTADDTVHTTDDTVHTTRGTVRGTVADGYRTFDGIPYAAPPVGGLRWASPRPAKPWSGTRDATRPASECPQTAGFLGDAPSDTEDCLYLNVTTPRNTRNKKLPVMFWIHGGGFYSGSGSLYGARRLAEGGNVIVVTLNYRLGVFGFLAHPALDDGADKSGDYGLEDQQAALRWVRDNAAAFGGDAGNVTLFGESAGGMSTCSHLAAPASAGLFQQAIIQSGPCTVAGQWPYPEGNWTVRPRAVAERQGEATAAELGCDDVACLRGKSVQDLLEASDGGQGFGPATGGVLPKSPAQALATGDFAHVPVIQGTTRDEHRTFVAAIEAFTGHTVTGADYRQDIEDFFGPVKAKKVLAEYPLTGDPSIALSTVWTDSAFSCTALGTDRLLSEKVPTYAYEFADESAPWASDGSAPSFPTGAFHASELQYLFDDSQFRTPLTAAQRRLSDQMIGYWTRFARTGNPNGGGAPGWRTFDGNDVQPLGGERRNFADEHRCGFWRSLGR
ncbi:carboxylesterase family protein [Actinomadura sp. DC4]|uniref:carboxylesterase/lipase family protein n=1 Tax=Actinomadura sp. DC4 TaxID=3055069 RepID=UPI0025B0A07A|nr:carboxylesterase family protein [Actinomadura sp. DC4]MDN3353489.1 carboxylesterase family protein [Actinomadura sp. DC4]